MQHGEKLIFDLLKPPQGSDGDRLGGEDGWGLWANIYYHVAAYVIPFNLICNMTML